MMWIDGVSPLAVLDAYVAATVALVVCGSLVAARQQDKHWPIMKYEPGGATVDRARHLRFDDAGGEVARRIVADRDGSRLHLAVFDNIPLTALALKQSGAHHAMRDAPHGRDCFFAACLIRSFFPDITWNR